MRKFAIITGYFSHIKKIFLIRNAVEESIYGIMNTWPGRNKPRGQSAETTWSIGRNHDVFKLLALSPIALGFFASALV